MKKSLRCLFTACFAVALMTACDEDNSKGPGPSTGGDVSGTYVGTITINISEEESENPIVLENQEFNVTQNGEESISLSILNLELSGMAPMDINVSDVPFSVDGDVVILNATDLNAPLKIGSLDAVINSMVGSFEGKTVSLKIVASQDLVGNVYISVTGERK